MAFLVLVVGVAFVIVGITVLKLHPFLALILGAILVGILSPASAERGRIETELKSAYPDDDARVQQELESRLESLPPKATLAVQRTAEEFGGTAGKIAIVIVLAAIIGQCLLESGAADRIVRSLLALFGQAYASLALMSTGYVLSVPVFFDTVFFLVVPLARALRMRLGKNFVLYVMAPCAGGAITHSLVPPTPGPLVMVENLSGQGLDLGAAIGFGFLLGLPPALAGLAFAAFVNRRLDIPVREAPGSSIKELEAIVNRQESELPGLVSALLPVLLPVFLITGQTLLTAIQKAGTDVPSWLLEASTFLGNANVALLISTVMAVAMLARQKNLKLGELSAKFEPAIASAGVIILITSAGGAFGKMLSRTGVAEALGSENIAELGGAGVVAIAWGIAALLKIAQGSGTVSMITTSAMMATFFQGTPLPCHVIYVFAAIGFGSLFISWMNDSGFWVVGKMSGFTEKETLATWTPLLGVMGLAGLIEVLILAFIFPAV